MKAGTHSFDGIDSLTNDLVEKEPRPFPSRRPFLVPFFSNAVAPIGRSVSVVDLLVFGRLLVPCSY